MRIAGINCKVLVGFLQFAINQKIKIWNWEHVLNEEQTRYTFCNNSYSFPLRKRSSDNLSTIEVTILPGFLENFR